MNNDLTVKLMQEIGLDIDNNKHIVDQDTGSLLQFNGKNLKFVENEEEFIPRGDAAFDPIGNPKLMNHLFSYYTSKIHDEDGRYVNIYYPVQDSKDVKKGAIELKEEKENIKLRSENYYNDSLKYMDLILQLNGEDGNLSEYDDKIK